MIISAFSIRAAVIGKISIQGNQRVEKSTIINYLGLDIGSKYSQEAKNDSLKNLYATSLFETIDIDLDQNVLKVTVKEVPFISEVVFKGNNKVQTKTITSQIYTARGNSLRKARLHNDVKKIKELYKSSGRFATEVKSKIEEQSNNRVKVTFEIEEGPKTGIKDIYFVGNEHYKDSELRSIIMTKRSRWFSFLETNDTYNPARIESDKRLLTSFYNSVGFADFAVVSVTADLLETKEGFILTYSLDEGRQYKFGKIDLKNKLTKIKDKNILQFIDNKNGETFDRSALELLSDKISNYLAENGYPEVEVSPKIIANRFTGLVDVTILVDNADKAYINKINIEGNLKTQDSVIRNQLKISEGDIYNHKKITQSERNIRNLNYFGRISMNTVSTKKTGRYNLNINVMEKSTASLGLNAGYNSSGGPFASIDFSERNLIGTGRHLTTSIQTGKKNIRFQLGLTEPRFLGKDLELGGTVFRSQNGRKSGFAIGEHKYKSKSTGARLALGYNITDDLSHNINYLIKQDESKSPDSDSSIFVTEQMGKHITSSIAHTLVYDRVDNRVFPKDGYLISGTQEFAGLGGNVKYLKHDLEGKYFKSFVSNKYTLKLSASIGHVKGVSGKKLRMSDRFNLGGESLRGFSVNGVGPRSFKIPFGKTKNDIDYKGGDSLGGQKYYTLCSELSFPIGLPEEFNVTGFVFLDAGSLWDVDSKKSANHPNTLILNDTSMRVSAGFGFLWNTRMAPIKMTWGFPLKKEKYDDKEIFLLGFSTSL